MIIMVKQQKNTNDGVSMSNKFLIAVAMLMILLSCSASTTKRIIVVTGNPVYAIVKELAGPRTDVVRLVPPGASPHTYQPKPSDMYRVQASNALIYISENNDGWAVNLPGSRKLIRLFDFLPNEYRLDFSGEFCCLDTSKIIDPNSIDPHFWLDPLAVKAILPKLADTLAKIDPNNAQTYYTNAELFAKRLDLLHRQVNDIIHPIKGKTVFLYHPSLLYFLKRYSFKYGGSIEESPGKEPSPQFVVNLTERIKASGTKAIFFEPQLSDRTARLIAESAAVDLYMLDPVGGDAGRENLQDIILYNARMLRRALE